MLMEILKKKPEKSFKEIEFSGFFFRRDLCIKLTKQCTKIQISIYVILYIEEYFQAKFWEMNGCALFLQKRTKFLKIPISLK